MRSFAGRDILSLKGFEREEFYRVFEVADRLAPIARDRRNSDLLAEPTRPPCCGWGDGSPVSPIPR